MRPLEFNGMIGRTQDFTQMKQNEDMKPSVDQQNFTLTHEKAVEVKSEQVNRHTDEDMDKDYDASKGNGNGEYEGNKKRKKKEDNQDEDGTVVIKGRNVSFDIKI